MTWIAVRLKSSLFGSISTAKDLGIEVGVLCPNGTLQSIARAAPKTVKDLGKVEDLKRWQSVALGSAALLEAVNGKQ